MSDPKENQKVIDDYDYLSNAASSGDCTGLIPALPQSKAEIDSYNELYEYLPPAVKKTSSIIQKNADK